MGKSARSFGTSELPAGSLASFRRLKVIVADGDPETRRVIHTALSLIGVTAVFEASDGEEVLSMLNHLAISVIIMELALDGIGGLPLIRIIRTSHNQEHRSLPIIVLSNFPEERVIHAARDAGATEFLAKPMSPGHLLTRVWHVVNHFRPLVSTESFIGPDRRRRLDVIYLGPERRAAGAILSEEERRFLSQASRTPKRPARGQLSGTP